jgi:hypothetical protein
MAEAGRDPLVQGGVRGGAAPYPPRTEETPSPRGNLLSEHLTGYQPFPGPVERSPKRGRRIRFSSLRYKSVKATAREPGREGTEEEKGGSCWPKTAPRNRSRLIRSPAGLSALAAARCVAALSKV